MFLQNARTSTVVSQCLITLFDPNVRLIALKMFISLKENSYAKDVDLTMDFEQSLRDAQWTNVLLRG